MTPITKFFLIRLSTKLLVQLSKVSVKDSADFVQLLHHRRRIENIIIYLLAGTDAFHNFNPL